MLVEVGSVDLEEELEQLPIGDPLRIEDDLDRLGVTGIVLLGRVVVPPPIHPTRVEMTPSRWRSSCCMIQKQPPARIAVSVLSLMAFVLPSRFC